MINKIAWKTYFVFMCFNFAFIPVIWFTFVETKGYPLEKLDAIFEEAYQKKENPVLTERRIRKGAKLEKEKAGLIDANGGPITDSPGNGTDQTDSNLDVEKFRGSDAQLSHKSGTSAAELGTPRE
jgi:hypothetical protein